MAADNGRDMLRVMAVEGARPLVAHMERAWISLLFRLDSSPDPGLHARTVHTTTHPEPQRSCMSIFVV